jgi:signal transduction histidine kinase
MTSATAELVTADLSLSSRFALKNLEQFFAHRLVDLRTWSDLRVMQDVLIDDQEGEIGRDLAKLRQQYPYFSDLAVTSAQGVVVASATPAQIGRNVADTPFWKASRGGNSYQSNVSPSVLSGARSMTFAEPIRASYDPDTIIGTLIGAIDWSQVQLRLGDVAINGSGQNADHLLVLYDRDHQEVLYRTAYVEDGLADLLHHEEEDEEREIETVEIEGREFIFGEAISVGDGQFRDPHWDLYAVIASDVALESVTSLGRRMVFLGLFAVICALVVGWLGARHLVKPIEALIITMKRLAAGDHSVKVPGRDRADEIGGMASALEVFRQAAQQRAVEQQELRQAKVAADAASRAKSEFLATMTHELRTPLNAVIGFSELINRQIYGPIQERRYLDYANDIHLSGKHLLSIINDVLDLSKAESGHISLDESITDPVAICATVMHLMSMQAQEAKVELRNLVRDLPGLRADERKMKQILLNLLANALKFTPAGGMVTLGAKIETTAACCSSSRTTASEWRKSRSRPPSHRLDRLRPLSAGSMRERD